MREDSARRSLKLDALWCAVVGVGVTVYSKPLSRELGLHPLLVSVAGLGTIVWSEYVRRASVDENWKRAVATIGAANVAASLGLLAWARSGPSFKGKLMLVTAAVQVGAFARAQALSLLPEPAGQ